MKNFYIKFLVVSLLILVVDQSIASFAKNSISNHKDSVQGLKWSCMKSNEERIAYLQKSLGSHVAQDFNYRLVHHYLLNLQACDEEVELFFKKLHESAAKDSFQGITMSNVDQAFSYVVINKTNRNIVKNITQIDDQLIIDNLVQEADELSRKFFTINPDKLMEIAWHEAAHGLEAARANRLLVGSQLSLNVQGFLGGAFITTPQFEANCDNSVSMRFHRHADKIDFVKSKINYLLAGGIGEMILAGKKLTFEEFEIKYQSSIGSNAVVGSDMWQVIQELIYASNLKKFTPICDFQEDFEPFVLPNKEERGQYIEKVLQECYEQTYVNLYANKDVLKQIVQEALEQKIISGDRIYQLAGKQRPKYDFEMSVPEKTCKSLSKSLAWTLSRMDFYHRHGENN